MTNALLIIFIAVGAGVIGTVFYVRAKVRSFSTRWFGNADLLEGIKQQQEIYDSTPKNVSSMTRLELPRLEKDFPEFDWPEWKRICESAIKGYLNAAASRDVSLAGNVSADIKDQINREIESDCHAEIEKKYDQIVIHDTQIARYEKKPGICRIRVESSVQYYKTLVEKGNTVLNNKMEQHIYIPELIYVQDPNLAGKEYSNAVGTNCPNCGAPVKMLGNKVCPYCGTAVEPINIRAWKLHRIDMEK